MKKSIKKLWGIGLIVVLLASLFLAAVPVQAANPLNWERSSANPGVIPFNVLATAGTNIVDFDIDGATAYAAAGVAPTATNALFQSTNGGAWWTDISARLNVAIVATVDYVVMAPDDPSILVVASTTPTAGAAAMISLNGGTTFTSMGTITDGTDTIAAVQGVAISPALSNGSRYIAIYGTDAGGEAGIFYYNYGAGIGAWGEAVHGFASGPDNADAAGLTNDATSVQAFSFSPIFQADYFAVAVTGNGTALNLNQLSFNSNTWNAEAGYPAALTDPGTTLPTYSAPLQVAMDLIPTYDGSDTTMRIAFVAATLTTGTSGYIWRANDAGIRYLYTNGTAGFNSIATDGTSLVAGNYADNNVMQSPDPFASSPTFSGVRNYQRIGVDDAGNDMVVVNYDGGVLYGAKSGDASAFAKSMDNGTTWDSYSLIDNTLTTVSDVYVTPDGSTTYIAANDGGESFVLKIAAGATSRILCNATGTQVFILRGIADDNDVLYVADTTTTEMYYTSDGGAERWFKRTMPAAAGDVAVEGASTIYVGVGTGMVYPSTNSGFTWGPGVSTTTGAIANLISVGEGQLVASGPTGIATSADSGASWASTAFSGGPGVTCYLAASGVGPDNYIFAAATGSTAVWQYNFNVPMVWNAITPAAAVGTNTGIVWTSDVLYTVSSNGTDSWLNRNLLATTPAAAFGWSTNVDLTENINSSVVKSVDASVAGDTITLYVWNTPAGIFYFDDTLAKAAPVSSAPADGQIIQLQSALLGASQNVNFSWSRPSQATNYTLTIGLDPAFTAIVTTVAVPSGAPVVSSIVPGATFTPGTTYYWRVAATAPLTSPSSEVRSFTVQQVAASVPQLGSPEIGSTTTSTSPAFSWTAIAGATSYKFELSSNAAFATTLYTDEVMTAGAQLPVTIELEPGQYFWRVKALSPNEGDWSTVGNFMVEEPVVQPTETGPQITITTQPAPTITITQPGETTITVPAPEPAEEIAPAYIWAIIVIGAILVIAVIILIVRTRRSV